VATYGPLFIIALVNVLHIGHKNGSIQQGRFFLLLIITYLSSALAANADRYTIYDRSDIVCLMCKKIGIENQ
jgi:hypothetical protein